MAVVSVAGGTVISTAQAETPIAQEDSQQTSNSSPVAVHENQATTNEYTVNTDALRVRTGPSTSNTILGLVTKDQTLQVVGETDGWYKIQYNNRDAYVSKDYVTPNQIIVDTTTLRVRTGPNTSNPTLGLVGQGEVLQVAEETDGWYKIQYNDRNGYVSKDYVTTDDGSTVKLKQTTVQANGTYTVNVSSLRVHTGPSTSHPVLGVVKKGQDIQVVGEVQDWYKVQFNGQSAYISKDYVSLERDNTSMSIQPTPTESVQQDGTYVVDAAVLRIRTGAASYHPVIGGILKGQVLQVIDVENGWYKVKYNERIGYVSSEFVKFIKGASTPQQEQAQQPAQQQPVQQEQAQQPAQQQPVQQEQAQQPAQQQPVQQEQAQQPAQQQPVQQEQAQQPAQQQPVQQEQAQQPAQQQPVQQEQAQQPTQQQSVQQEQAQQPTQQQPVQQEQTQQPTQQQSVQQEQAQQPAQQQPVQDFYVKPSTLNVRNGAGMNYGVIGVVQSGQKVQVVGQQAGWYKIIYNGKTGFVGMSHLSKTPIPVTEQQSSVVSTPNEVKASGFIKPAIGSYTSGFGKRSGQMHYGLDIAASGTVPIAAAADGVVTRSYFSASYGNVVFVSHNINGQTYTTVYAHLSSRSVSAGQRVTQGQQLGFMGNTGESEGQHLHFEIHKGGWNIAKSNAVDPRPYID
ncbi:SH3 domain-containing protein [Ectobacillus funiculus]|uniref:SH3 domain-containing protein n=2 Tax=Ectobacillus funiculus TaxID=137993 RepID=A0ABV5WFW0_9BACI